MSEYLSKMLFNPFEFVQLVNDGRIIPKKTIFEGYGGRYKFIRFETRACGFKQLRVVMEHQGTKTHLDCGNYELKRMGLRIIASDGVRVVYDDF